MEYQVGALMLRFGVRHSSLGYACANLDYGATILRHAAAEAFESGNNDDFLLVEYQDWYYYHSVL